MAVVMTRHHAGDCQAVPHWTRHTKIRLTEMLMLEANVGVLVLLRTEMAFT